MSIITNSFQKFNVIAIVAVFSLITILLPLIASLPASAAAPAAPFNKDSVSAVWIDRVTIEVTISGTKYTFIDGGGLNDDRDYKFQIQDSTCHGEIKGFDGDYLTADKAAEELDFDIDYLPPDGECTDFGDGEFSETIASPANAMISFRWISKDRIQTVDGEDGWYFTDDTTTPALIFIKENETECKDKLVVSADRRTAQFFELDSDGLGGDPPPEANASGSGCELFLNNENIDRTPETNNPPSVISTPLGNFAQSSSDTQEVIGTGGGSGSSTSPSCESEGGAFSFVICPLLEFADGAIATLDARIFSALVVGEDTYGSPQLRESWARIRNIAYIILIPVMLVMVISTALGFNFVDAYTVKRALPRLFVAIIFMALSFDIAVIMINIVNGIGQGISGVIAQPFGGLQNLQLTDIFEANAVNDGLLIAGGIGMVAAGFIGIGIIASYMLVAALVLLTVFIMLALRRVLLIALILLAPFAIISWIFPGNDKGWKIWWGSFSKLLLLFPIIMVLLVTGRVFASIVDNSEGGLFSTIIKLTAFIGPYFLIPAAFKFAGGAFANVAGMVNNRSKGIYDSQSKYRDRKKKEAREGNAAGTRWNPGSKMGKAFNSSLMTAANAKHAGIGGVINPKKGLGRIKSYNVEHENMERDAMTEDKENTWKGNDTLNKAAYKSHSEKELRKILTSDSQYDYVDDSGKLTEWGAANLDSDVAKVERMRKKYGHSAFQQATWRMAVKGGTAHGKAGNEAEMYQDLAHFAGDDLSVLADNVAYGRSAAISAGRVDEGGAGFGDTLEITKAFVDAERTGANMGDVLKEQSGNLRKAVAKSQPESTKWHSSMKPYAVRNQILEVQRRIVEVDNRMAAAEASGNVVEYQKAQEDMDREMATVANAYDMLGQSAPQLAAELDTNLLNWSPEQGVGIAATEYNSKGGVTQADGWKTPAEKSIRSKMDKARQSDAFRSRRRELTAEQQEQSRLGGGGTFQPPGTGAGGGINSGPNQSFS